MNQTEINALVKKWQPVLDQASVIPSWTEPHCLAFLAELASKSSQMIEMGSYLGRSAKVMLLANPKLTLYCIDTFECAGEPWCMSYLERVGHHGKLRDKMTTYDICSVYTLREEVRSGRCKLIRGNSEEGARQMIMSTHLGTSQGWVPEELLCEAIWIDDGHLKTDLERDIRSLMPFLKPGGVMVGHDFDPGGEVEQGVFSMLPKEKVQQPVPRLWSYTKPLHSYGISSSASSGLLK